MPTIEMTEHESTMLHSTGYDEAAHELHVIFKSGGPLYIYEQVPPEIHQQLQQSESKGRFFLARIKGAFKHRKQ